MSHTETGDFFYDFLYEENPLAEGLARLGFLAFDQERQKARCSRLWRSWGYDEEDMKNRRLLDICHPDDRGKVERLFTAIQSGAQDENQEVFRIRTREGRWVWVRHSGLTVAPAKQGGAGLYIGHETDLTDIKETEERLRLLTLQSEVNSKESATLLEAAKIVTSSLDVDEAVTLILEQAKIVVPYDKASVQLLQNGGLELVGGNGFADLAAIKGLIFPYPEKASLSTLAIEGKKAVVCRDVSRDFPGFVYAELEKPTRSWMGIPLIAHGNVLGLLSFNHSKEDYFNERHVQLASGFAVHVAVALENARLYEKTFKLAMEDALMGIGNRHLFNMQAPLLYESARRKKTALSIAILDLDHFKSINDTYGHDNGDTVLMEIGRICRRAHRITDLVARFGGEEIVLLFPETEADIAFMLSERLRKSIEGLEFEFMGRPVTISTGIASEIPDQDSTFSDLLKCADTALYAAKKNGRNRTEVFKSS